MLKRSHLIAGLVGIIAVLCGLFIYSSLEPYTRYVDEGPNLDVQLNPWNAAQRYLQHFNIESHRSFYLHPVLKQLRTTDTLVLANNGPITNPSLQQQLLEWMENGGHLVLTAYNEWDAESESSGDDFLDILGIRLHSGAQEPAEVDIRTLDSAAPAPHSELDHDHSGAQGNAEMPKPQPEANAPEPAELSCPIPYPDNINQLRVDNYPLQIESVTGLTLEPAYDVEAVTGKHFPNSILQIPVGSGLITVLLDTGIWLDPRIGELDHAFLLWYLVKDSTTAWLVSSDNSENLVQLLWRTAPYLLITLLITLLIWCWQRGGRFGPLVAQSAFANRKITEHIEASARFEWNHGQARTLLEPLRDDIKQRVARHCTCSFHHDQAAWLQYVAPIAPIEPDQLAHIMSCEAPSNEQSWTQLINQLQHVRNAL